MYDCTQKFSKLLARKTLTSTILSHEYAITDINRNVASEQQWRKTYIYITDDVSSCLIGKLHIIVSNEAAANHSYFSIA